MKIKILIPSIILTVILISCSSTDYLKNNSNTGSLTVSVIPQTAEVYLTDSSGNIITEWIGESKNLKVPPGNYYLIFQKSGYQTVINSLRIENNDQIDQTIFLIEDNCGLITDINGNIYKTTKIGEQCWMAENLRTSHYRDGSEIPNLYSWNWFRADNSRLGGWANYNDSELNDRVFGKLYNWYAIDDNRGLCPVSWEVPSDKDWMQLEVFLGLTISEANSLSFRGARRNVGLLN